MVSVKHAAKSHKVIIGQRPLDVVLSRYSGDERTLALRSYMHGADLSIIDEIIEILPKGAAKDELVERRQKLTTAPYSNRGEFLRHLEFLHVQTAALQQIESTAPILKGAKKRTSALDQQNAEQKASAEKRHDFWNRLAAEIQSKRTHPFTSKRSLARQVLRYLEAHPANQLGLNPDGSLPSENTIRLVLKL